MSMLGAVLNEGGFRRHLIFVEDLGTGGLKFRSDMPYKKHEVVEILLQLHDQQYRVNAEIRHVVSDYFGYACGVQFIQPDAELVRHISKLFANLTPEQEASARV